jgi:hypothetical protein
VMDRDDCAGDYGDDVALWCDKCILAAALTDHATCLQQMREATLKEALAAVTAEHLEDPQNEEDEAYDRAIVDARQAIGRLLRAVSAFPDQCMGIYRVGTMGVLKR